VAVRLKLRGLVTLFQHRAMFQIEHFIDIQNSGVPVMQSQS
jgi:hypothetical protein